MSYFSEIEEGEIPRTIEDFNDETWAGVRALIHAHIKDGSFGASYSDMCEDGCGPIGCAEDQFLDALQAEVPRIEKSYIYRSSEGVWETMDILDTIQFCWRCIGQPIQVDYHKFFQHHHLRFDIEAGREKFCEDINRIFRRNGLVYELTIQGTIERLVTPVLREKILSFQFQTGDTELDCMLETAQRKFLNPDNVIRREALEKLWDAWERLKTTGPGSNKKSQVKSLLDGTASECSPKFRNTLENEANILTEIGNSFQIRHSETTQERLIDESHSDYLFHRLFALIDLIIRRNS